MEYGCVDHCREKLASTLEIRDKMLSLLFGHDLSRLNVSVKV
jgi:hypothetical protein